MCAKREEKTDPSNRRWQKQKQKQKQRTKNKDNELRYDTMAVYGCDG